MQRTWGREPVLALSPTEIPTDYREGKQLFWKPATPPPPTHPPVPVNLEKSEPCFTHLPQLLNITTYETNVCSLASSAARPKCLKLNFHVSTRFTLPTENYITIGVMVGAGIEGGGRRSRIIVEMGQQTKLGDRWCQSNWWKVHLHWQFVIYIEVYEKFRFYWLGFCGKIANGLMVSLYFNRLENYSEACRMPEPHIYLRMSHREKLSFTKVTERAADRHPELQMALAALSVAEQRARSWLSKKRKVQRKPTCSEWEKEITR